MVKISLFPRSFLFKVLLASFFCFWPLCSVWAQESSESAGFAAVWKLMSSADKERFVSGYLRGWKDASGFLDIANEYVKNNPKEAPNALAKLRELANLGEQKPGPLAIFIDQFYKKPENQRSPLSKAVSAARFSGVSADSLIAAEEQ